MSTASDPLGVAAPERPVFVAENGRRARALRAAILAATACTSVWLVALLAGAFGLGRLPALPLPSVGRIDNDGGGADARPIGHGRDGGAAAGAIERTHSSFSSTHLRSTIDPSETNLPLKRRAVTRRRTAAVKTLPTTAGVQPSPAVTPLTTAAPTTTTPTSKDRAPAYTPSGNPVAAGTTTAGPTYPSRRDLAPGTTRSQR